MVRRAMIARSRAEAYSSGSGQPVVLAKWELVSPIFFAASFIRSTNACSDPARPSASTTQASLPETVTMPWSRSSTVTCAPTGRNMVEPRLFQARQVSGETVILSSSFTVPFLIMSKAT